jgi:hypothetical protein
MLVIVQPFTLRHPAGTGRRQYLVAYTPPKGDLIRLNRILPAGPLGTSDAGQIPEHSDGGCRVFSTLKEE